VTCDSRGALIALPCALSLFVLPVDSPFLLPKRALLVFAAALLCGAAVTTGRLALPRGRDARLITGLAALASVAVLISWTLSAQRELGLQAALFWVAGPTLAMVVCATLDRPRRLIAATALAGGIQSAIVAAQWFFAVNPAAFVGVHVVARDRMRLYGTLGNPDFVATFIAATLPSALMLTWNLDPHGSKRSRWFWYAIIGLDLAASVATGARTGGVAALIGLAATAWFLRTPEATRSASLNWRHLATGILVAAAAFVLLARNPRKLDESFAGRTTIWRIALLGHMASPTGSGPGTFPRTYDIRMSAYAGAHREPDRERFFAYEATALNDYVQTLVETGWLGTLTLVGGLVWWFYAVVRKTREPQLDISARAPYAAAIGSVAALAAAALGESPFQRADTWALLWLALALPFASTRPRDTASSSRVMVIIPVLLASLTCAWLAARPVAAAWFIEQGTDAESAGARGAAVSAYRRAVSFDTINAVAWFGLSRTLTRTREYDAALHATEQAMRLRPEPEISLLRVRILDAKGAHAYAVRELAAAMKMFPWRTDLLIEAGRLTRSTSVSSPR
jgi:O-antigen ligase